MHIHNFKLDRTRIHKRAGRCFTICECGETGQASLETGKRFTTGRKPVEDKKKQTGLKTYQYQREFLESNGLSVQKFFDVAFSEFVNKVNTVSV